jgi:hypothetical protein
VARPSRRKPRMITIARIAPRARSSCRSYERALDERGLIVGDGQVGTPVGQHPLHRGDLGAHSPATSTRLARTPSGSPARAHSRRRATHAIAARPWRPGPTRHRRPAPAARSARQRSPGGCERPLGRHDHVPPLSRIRPAGSSRFCASSAPITSPASGRAPRAAPD